MIQFIQVNDTITIEFNFCEGISLLALLVVESIPIEEHCTEEAPGSEVEEVTETSVSLSSSSSPEKSHTSMIQLRYIAQFMWIKCRHDSILTIDGVIS